jgi:hypothetical protein
MGFTLGSGKASYSNGVFGGLNRTLVAALVAGVVLVLPPAAFADCNGGVSAVNVYKECVQTGGGGKPTGGGGKHTGGGGGGSSSSTTGGPTGGSTGVTPVPISRQTRKTLAKAGSDRKALKTLVRGLGSARLLQSSNATADEPTAVGSAFDLGSGPTALLIVLASTAILLLAAGGFRGVRQRRR